MAKIGATTTVTESLNDILAVVEGSYLDTYVFAIDATDGLIEKGTVVGVVTASGEAKVYDNSHSDGTETAVGIINESIDTTIEKATASVIIKGFVRKDKCFHYAAGTKTASIDAAGVTDLNGRETQNNLLQIG